MYKDPPVTDEQRQVWKTEVDRLGEAIDAAWKRLRKADIIK